MFKYKKTIFFIIILAIVGGYFFYSRSKKPVAEYTTVKVERKNLAQTVSVSGKIVSPSEVDLSFNSTGRLKSVLVDVGDSVKKDQPVAVMDAGTLFHELAQAQADLKNQKEILENMKRKGDAYTKEQRDGQRALIVKADEAVKTVWKNIDEKKIYAPIDGVVGRKNIDAGELVTVGTAVLTLFQSADLEISANIPESDIVKIKLGQNADLTLDALPAGEKLKAQVFEIEPASTVIQDVVYYKIKLKLDHQDERLKNGMSTDIDIRTEEKENVLVVPARAIKTEGTEKFVEILKDAKNNITERKKITTGLEGDEGLVEVKSGLSGGEEVVTFVKSV